MNSHVQIYCENWETLLKNDSSLKKEQVFLQSELLYELLVPRSRERYDGVRRNFFGYVEWRYELDDDVFFNLVEQTRISLDAARVVSYLKKLLDLLEKDDQSFPGMYALLDADAKKASMLLRYELTGAKLEAGYDICLSDVQGVWEDLRKQSSFEGVDSDGRKKQIKIVRRSIQEVFGSLFQTMLSIADTANSKGVKLCLSAQHDREEFSRYEPLPDGEKPGSEQSDEVQIRSYMKMVEEIPIPLPEEEEDLVRKMELFGEEGAAARQRLSQGYFRLVISLATKYLERKVRLLDLIPQANQALSQAVEQYDFASSITFSQYATWRIETALLHFVGDADSEGEMPRSLEKKLEQIKVLSEKLKKEKGRSPSEKELADAMGIDIDQLRRLFEQV